MPICVGPTPSHDTEVGVMAGGQRVGEGRPAEGGTRPAAPTDHEQPPWEAEAWSRASARSTSPAGAPFLSRCVTIFSTLAASVRFR